MTVLVVRTGRLRSDKSSDGQCGMVERIDLESVDLGSISGSDLSYS